MDNDILTPKQVAELLNVKSDTIRQWRKTGKIKYRKLGHHTIRFFRSDIDEFMKKTETGGVV